MRFATILRNTVLITLVAVLVSACSSSDSDSTTQPGGTADVIDVTIDNFTFDESSVSASVGDTVRWTNEQSTTHTVTSGDELWDSTLSSGDMFEFTFDEAGSYPYFCAIHPSMTGTIEVAG
jgi:plastocyanin